MKEDQGNREPIDTLVSDIRDKHIPNSSRQEADSHKDFATMDVRSVVNMLEEIKIEMKTAISEAVQMQQENKCQCKCTRQAIDTVITEKVKKITDRQDDLARELHISNAKQRMMINSMSYSADVTREVQEKIEAAETNSAKRMVIISGLETVMKHVIARRQISDFLTDCLQVADVEIDDFYYKGVNYPKDIVVTFPTTSQKHRVMQNTQLLKNLTNRHGNKFFVRNYKTTRQMQFTKKVQQIKNRIQERDPVDQEEVTMKGPEIFVGDEQYVKKVNPPSTTAALRLPIHELNVIMAMNIDVGDRIEVKGNRFTAYSLCTTKYEKINQAYMKIRLNHAEARHIVCAWNIPGTQDFERTDGCDDEDHGVSEAIIQMLLENQVSHRAIFVVRNCQEKLHAERIPSYLKAVKNVVTKYPVNSITQIQDKVQTLEDPTSYAAAVTTRG